MDSTKTEKSNPNLTEQDNIEIDKLIKETNATYETVLSAYLYKNKNSDMAYLMISDTFNAGFSAYEK